MIFKSDSIEKIIKSIQLLKAENPFYLDLAGGISIDHTLDDTIINENLGDIIKNKKATNTTYGYMLNYQALKIFDDVVSKNRYAKLIINDWLINTIFRKPSSNKIICLHSNTPFFEHGSKNGLYPTLIQFVS